MAQNKASARVLKIDAEGPVKKKKGNIGETAPETRLHIAGPVENVDKTTARDPPKQSAKFEKELQAARLGYGKIAIFEDLFVLKFGRYNDRALDKTQVQAIVHSMQTDGVHRFGVNSMIPALVDPNLIQVKQLSQDSTVGYDMPEVLLTTQKDWVEFDALSGQHRNAALQSMVRRQKP
ncbi:hypothetical protein B0H21DRAFT_829327 [Amylocystis lapponica]|nr:hypothetical protein B0H21DRAFT_829327 [Amylocystis lapponica]